MIKKRKRIFPAPQSLTTVISFKNRILPSKMSLFQPLKVLVKLPRGTSWNIICFKEVNFEECCFVPLKPHFNYLKSILDENISKYISYFLAFGNRIHILNIKQHF